MSGSQAGLLVLLVVVVAAAAVVLLAVVRHAPRSRAAEMLGRGAFREALAGGDQDADRLPAAVAARHLLELDRAARLLDAHLAAEPDDGEALVERGLAAAYLERWDEAEAHLSRALAARADLAESITLHRAWLSLRRGRPAEAQRRFEEVEAAIESKLRSDLAGDPLFAEWYLHAAVLWLAAGRRQLAVWAWRQGRAAAPESRLFERLGGETLAAAGEMPTRRPAPPRRPLQ